MDKRTLPGLVRWWKIFAGLVHAGPISFCALVVAVPDPTFEEIFASLFGAKENYVSVSQTAYITEEHLSIVALA